MAEIGHSYRFQTIRLKLKNNFISKSGSGIIFMDKQLLTSFFFGKFAFEKKIYAETNLVIFVEECP